jgi:hypothetical protein
MVPLPTIIATWPSHTARLRGRNEPASIEVGCAEGADGIGVGEHAVRTAAATVRFH